VYGEHLRHVLVVKAVKVRPLQATIGERLRQVRQDRSFRQEDIAAGARRIGLRWNRATVALVENGVRALSIGEFLALPVLYNMMVLNSASFPIKRWSALVDFLPEEGDLEISKSCILPASTLQNVAKGDDHAILTSTLSVPRGADEEIFDEALGDAEEKAARRLKVSAVDVAKAARELWGESLTEKRDREVAAKLGDVSSPRTLQAVRGHVTRALTNVLSSRLVKSSSKKPGSFARINDAALKHRRVRRRRRQSSDQQP